MQTLKLQSFKPRLLHTVLFDHHYTEMNETFRQQKNELVDDEMKISSNFIDEFTNNRPESIIIKFHFVFQDFAKCNIMDASKFIKDAMSVVFSHVVHLVSNNSRWKFFRYEVQFIDLLQSCIIFLVRNFFPHEVRFVNDS